MSNFSGAINSIFSCAFNPLSCISDLVFTKTEDPIQKVVEQVLTSQNTPPPLQTAEKLITSSFTDWMQWQTALAIGGCTLIVLGMAYAGWRRCKYKPPVETPKTPVSAQPVEIPATPATAKEDPKTIFHNCAEELMEDLTTPNQKAKLFLLMSAFHLINEEFEDAKLKAREGMAIKAVAERTTQKLTILVTRAQTGSSSIGARRHIKFDPNAETPDSPTVHREKKLPTKKTSELQTDLGSEKKSRSSKVSPLASNSNESTKEVKLEKTSPFPPAPVAKEDSVKVTAAKEPPKPKDPPPPPEKKDAAPKPSGGPPPPPPPPPPASSSIPPNQPTDNLMDSIKSFSFKKIDRAPNPPPQPPNSNEDLAAVVQKAVTSRRKDIDSQETPVAEREKKWQ